MAYATQAELEARTGVTFTPARALAALEDAAGKIDSYVGGSLTQVIDAQDRMHAYGTRRLFLPGPPTTGVSAVSTVDEDGTLTLLVATAYQRVGNELVRVDGDLWPKGEVVVTRTRGWLAGAYPGRLIGINCSLAARTLQVPSGVSRRKLGDFEEQFATSVEDPGRLEALLDAEKWDLDMWSFRAGEVHG